MEHTKNTKWHNVKQKSSTSSSTSPLNATTTHSSLALISFHGRGFKWGWMWSWTRRVTIQISYASGAMVVDIHIPSRPSEFDSNCISSIYSIPIGQIHCLCYGVVTAASATPLESPDRSSSPLVLSMYICDIQKDHSTLRRYMQRNCKFFCYSNQFQL